MITILVNKATREIFMGRTDNKETDEEILLSDIVVVQFMEVQQGVIQPVPFDWLPFAGSMLFDSAVSTMDSVSFQTNDFFVFSEKSIKKEMEGWYAQIMAKKSGIELSTSNIIH
jgi:hypothetical protein